MNNYATEIKDAFRPSLNPVLHELTGPTSIRNILINQGVIDEDGTRITMFVVAVDGDYKLEDDWEQLIYPHNLMVTVAIPPHLQGGGGSNPLRLVMMVAVMAAGFYLPELVGLTAGGFGASALSAGVMIGGTMLINALLPSPKVSGSNDGAQAKEVFFIGPQANSARLGSPIATLYGRRRIYPDLIAQPYVEINGNDTYLHQIFCLTQGKIDIEQILIEKTPIANFADVQYKVYLPFEFMTMFPDNVYTAQEVADLKLEASGIGMPFVIGYKEKLSYVETEDANGNKPGDPWYVRTYIKTSVYVPLVENVQFQGGFVSTPLQSETELIAVDMHLPKGLVSFDEMGNPMAHVVRFIVQARLIDSSNNPAGDWIDLTKITQGIPEDKTEIIESGVEMGGYYENDYIESGIPVYMATIDPIVQSYAFNVPKGRYEVRVARLGMNYDTSRIIDEIHWIGLRSYMPSKQFYGDVTLLAMKVKASNNINNNIARRVNVLGTRILPVFDGEKWEERPTRSISWAVADMLRNKEYGRGLKDSRINLKELERLDKTWSSRNDHFDGYFTEQVTIWEALTRALEVGRAKPMYVAGVIDFVRNEPRIAPTQMFTPENIVQDSHQVNYAFPKTGEADHIIVEYTDPISWQPADMVCALPDSKMFKPIRVAMHSITSPQQAWREGIHRAAMHHVQREFVTWTTELEGMAVSYGNEILLAYDEPEWGTTGRIESFNGNIIHTSEDLDWSSNNVIALRAKNGGVMGTYKIERIDETSGIIPDLPLNKYGQPNLSDGSYSEPTHYIFGNTNRTGRRLVITSVAPDSNNQVTLSGVVYSDYPHRVEYELEMPVVVPPHGDIEEVLTITWIKVKKTVERDIFEVSCNQARGGRYYEFELLDGIEWKLLQKSETSIYTGPLLYGVDIKIRARAIGTYAGEWFMWTGEVSKEETAISKTQPGLKVDMRGDNPIFADVTVTGVDLPTTTNYYIEENGIVIWAGILLKGQSATITRQFEIGVPEDPEEPPIKTQVEFKAYAVDGNGNRSKVSIVEMIY